MCYELYCFMDGIVIVMNRQVGPAEHGGSLGFADLATSVMCVLRITVSVTMGFLQ